MRDLQKLSKNVGELCKLIVAQGIKKLPNLVTLIACPQRFHVTGTILTKPKFR